MTDRALLAAWLSSRAAAFELDATHLSKTIRETQPAGRALDTARAGLEKAVAVAAELRAAAHDLRLETEGEAA